MERLSSADVVYVGGGSTLNLLALWRAHGVDAVLADLAARDDAVLAGVSAGANCWYEACSTDLPTRGQAPSPRTHNLVGEVWLTPGSEC